MELSSKPGGTDKRFGAWADELAAAFVPLEPRKIADDPFQGSIARAAAASVKVSRVTASRHRVLRLRSHVARGKDDVCFVNLQLRGMGRYTQRGHEQICRPGDLAIADTTEPFEIANARDFEVFCFAIPKTQLPRRFFERPRLAVAATEAGRALSRTITSYAELCLTAGVPPEILASSGAHIVELVAQADRVLESPSSQPMRAPVLLSMMTDHIERHSGDPDISAAALAAKFRCSERYVHKLFASTGRSVGEHVNERRIVVAARELLAQPHSSIAEIAFAAGFRDISHFNRLFKHGNGATPREFRRAQCAAGQ